jgi:RHS repeat-associated protein
MPTFDRNVLSATSTTVAAGIGTVSSTTFSGNTATVSLSGVADRQTITIELDNVVGVVGINSKVLVSMSVLIGDVNQDGAVTAEDVFLIRSHSLAAIDSSTFKYDVNADGRIDSSDVYVDRVSEINGDSLFPDFAFTGHYYHARSGLYLAPYRAYNPTIGRWLSRDPLGEVFELNLYAYVENHPLKEQDPLGLQTVTVPSGPILLPPVVPNPPGSNPNTPGGAVPGFGGAMANALSSISRLLTTSNALAQCRAMSPPSINGCNCCVVVLSGHVSDGGYMNWTQGSGTVVKQSCRQAMQADKQQGILSAGPPTITEVEYHDQW